MSKQGMQVLHAKGQVREIILFLLRNVLLLFLFSVLSLGRGLEISALFFFVLVLGVRVYAGLARDWIHRLI